MTNTFKITLEDGSINIIRAKAGTTAEQALGFFLAERRVTPAVASIVQIEG